MTSAARAALALLLAGCTQGPGSVTATATLDDGGQDGSGGSEDGSGASSSSSASSSATSDSGTSGSPGSATTTSATSGSGSASVDSGMELVCDNPAFSCVAPIQCDAECGTLDALFDDDGCLRRECSTHDECGSAEACYRAQDFGGCAPSGAGCDDISGECQCGSNPDCGGARCVPIDLYPVPIQNGPSGPGIARRECGEGDGLSLTIELGTGLDACDAAADPELTITIEGYVPGNVHYAIGDAESAFDADGIAATGGHFFVSDEVDGVVSGDYAIVFEDRELVGSFEALPVCGEGICG